VKTEASFPRAKLKMVQMKMEASVPIANLTAARQRQAAQKRQVDPGITRVKQQVEAAQKRQVDPGITRVKK